jgi:hypothetical protein
MELQKNNPEMGCTKLDKKKIQRFDVWNWEKNSRN